MYVYTVEYAVPASLAFPQDGITWIVAETVSAGISGKALKAARKDAVHMRQYATQVRIRRNGRTVR